MEGRLSTMFMCMTLIAACMLHTSLGQTTHVVGDALGWIVPPGGPVAYQTWAAMQTFNVGDILMFNYTTNMHDVAEVSREAYDSCNSTNPMAMYTNGPTNITLTSAGEHHFICTFSQHCSFGQRLAINVSTVSPTPAPAPQPSTTPSMAPSPIMPTVPSPSASPAPAPSRGPTTHVVGDALGWVVPPGGPVAYRTWAMGRTFMVGDTLVFNFTTSLHDVAEVTRAEFNSCNASTTTNVIMNGPARIRLTSAGEHYYICTFSQHCTFGQQLAINVTGESSTMAPTGGPAMQPGGPGMQPSTPSTPSMAPPPPSNSASSFAMSAVPFTVLAIALAFFV